MVFNVAVLFFTSVYFAFLSANTALTAFMQGLNGPQQWVRNPVFSQHPSQKSPGRLGHKPSPDSQSTFRPEWQTSKLAAGSRKESMLTNLWLHDNKYVQLRKKRGVGQLCHCLILDQFSPVTPRKGHITQSIWVTQSQVITNSQSVSFLFLSLSLTRIGDCCRLVPVYRSCSFIVSVTI